MLRKPATRLSDGCIMSPEINITSFNILYCGVKPVTYFKDKIAIYPDNHIKSTIY